MVTMLESVFEGIWYYHQERASRGAARHTHNTMMIAASQAFCHINTPS
jgi:hypothetical protein